MPMCDIKDHKTGETLKAYDFGGPEIYYAGTSLVYAPLGGTSVSSSENLATLNPLGITSIMKQRWEITGHVGIGTTNWRVSVVDTSTGETKDGVYPFNLHGNVYELECQPGTWVMASCGGYKIESSWSGQQSDEAYRLKGTGEIIKLFTLNVVANLEVTNYFVGARADILIDRASGSISNPTWDTVGGPLFVGIKGNVESNGSTDWYLEYYEGTYTTWYHREPVKVLIDNYWYGASNNFPLSSYKGYHVDGFIEANFSISRSVPDGKSHYLYVNVPSLENTFNSVCEQLKATCINTYNLKENELTRQYYRYAYSDKLSALSSSISRGYDYVHYKSFYAKNFIINPRDSFSNNYLNSLDNDNLIAVIKSYFY